MSIIAAKNTFQKAIHDLAHKPVELRNHEQLVDMFDVARESAFELISLAKEDPSLGLKYYIKIWDATGVDDRKSNAVIDEEYFARDFLAGEVAMPFIDAMKALTGGQDQLINALSTGSVFTSSIAWNRYNLSAPGLFRAFVLKGIVSYPLINSDGEAPRTTDNMWPLTAGIPYGRYIHLKDPDRLSYYLRANLAAFQSEKTASMPLLELAAYCASGHILQGKTGINDGSLNENIKLILSYLPNHVLASFDHALSYQIMNYLHDNQQAQDSLVSTQLLTSMFARLDALKTDFSLMALPDDLARPELTSALATSINNKFNAGLKISNDKLVHEAELLSVLFTRYQFDIFSVEAEDLRNAIPEGALSHLEYLQFSQQNKPKIPEQDYRENMTAQFTI